MWSVLATAEYVACLLFGALMYCFCDEILFLRKRNRNLAFWWLGIAQGIAFWLTPVSLPFHATVLLILAVALGRSFVSTNILTWGIGLVIGMSPLLLFNTNPELREANGLINSPDWVSFSILFNKANSNFLDRLQNLPYVWLALFRDSFPVLFGGAVWQLEEGLWKKISILVLSSFSLLSMLFLFSQRDLWKPECRRKTFSRIDIFLLNIVVTILLFSLNQSGKLTLEPRYLLPIFVSLPFAAACLIETIIRKNRVLGWSTLSLILLMNAGGVIWFSKSANPDHSLWPLDKSLNQYLVDHQIETPIAGFWVGFPIAFATRQKITPIPIYLTRFKIFKKPAQINGQNNYYFYIFPKHSEKDREILRLLTNNSSQGTFWSAQIFQMFLSKKGSTFKPESIDFEYYRLFKVHAEHLNPVSFVTHAGY
ncbi:MAG: hypothetical protein HQM14_22085 [SAR324 cluster bacterium]|nr:hypothetical protein [SAR324 cluster bacterium]